MSKPRTHISYLGAAILGLGWSFCVFAGKPEPVPEPPDIPPVMVDGEAIEPEVTIIEQQDKVIKEYRVNGRLYMVMVIPQVGPPYYLLDRDGDGELDFRSYDPRMQGAPLWPLLRW